jgi:hypothetical protein
MAHPVEHGSERLFSEIETWRQHQNPLPYRSEAIRRLVERGSFIGTRKLR